MNCFLRSWNVTRTPPSGVMTLRYVYDVLICLKIVSVNFTEDHHLNYDQDCTSYSMEKTDRYCDVIYSNPAPVHANLAQVLSPMILSLVSPSFAFQLGMGTHSDGFIRVNEDTFTHDKKYMTVSCYHRNDPVSLVAVLILI